MTVGALQPRKLMTPSSMSNCNITMWNGLYSFADYSKAQMLDALWSMTTAPQTSIGFPDGAYGGYGKCVQSTVQYTPPSSGIWCFAQGSDHSVDLHPYGPNFKRLIEELKLGPVVETVPAPNPLHSFRPGILYAWVLDRDAIARWWKTEHDRRSGSVR